MNYYRNILVSVIILNIIGLLSLLSASMLYLNNTNTFQKIIFVQLVAIFLGFSSIYFIQKKKWINYLSIKKYSIHFLFFALILQLLILVPGLGVERNFSLRWLNLGGVIIQPSEIFRFALIIFSANLFFSFGKELESRKFLIGLFSAILSIILFYWYIHDFGSLMILLVAIFSIFLLRKNNWKIPAVLISVFILLVLIFVSVSDHARKRVDTYWKSLCCPEKLDLRGEYYHSYNMIKAVGSGGINGIGYGGSIQKFNKSLPESVSDSIFSIFAEEWGFFGSFLFLSIYFFLSLNIFLAAWKIQNNFEKMIVVGLGLNILFPAFYNIYAALGLVPISGMPLSFISKGGTSILISLISIGIILLFVKKVK